MFKAPQKRYVELKQCAMCNRVFREDKLKDNICPNCYAIVHPTPIKPVPWIDDEQIEVTCKECGKVFMRNANAHPRFCAECNEKHRVAASLRRKEKEKLGKKNAK